MRIFLGAHKEASIRMALSRAICASRIGVGVSLHGRHRRWRQIKTNDLPSMKEWSQSLGGDAWTSPKEYREAFEIAMTGRCFCITENG